MIVRALAGVAGKARPLFLKVVYHGPAAMQQLAGYDSRLIVGILGGAAGTTFDAFQQLWEAKKYGALRGPLRADDQPCRAPIDFHRAPPRPGRRPEPAEAVRVPRRFAATEDSTLSPPGRRSAADVARQRLWQFPPH